MQNRARLYKIDTLGEKGEKGCYIDVTKRKIRECTKEKNAGIRHNKSNAALLRKAKKQ